MINRLIDVALKNRFIVIALYLGLAAWGWWALRSTPIDAIPDLSDNQVIVFTDWPGHSPQEVEDQVTYPLTTNLQGLAGVRVVRSQSAFGFSMVYVIFEDNVDLYFARTRVLERMSLVAKLLPTDVVPTLGPDATGVGHVFWYTVESPSHTLRELRTLQDWFIRYQLNSVPGVAEVASVGGRVQQYQIDVDPNRLRAYNLTLSAVVSAVRESNLNVGGNVLESNGAWLLVRGVGLIQSADDVKRIVVGASHGVPIYVEQIADVHVGEAFRVASLVKGTKEAVGGVVVARTGVNTKAVIDRVKARIAQIEPGLPPGVRIVPFYDRSRLIEQAVATLRTTLIEEIVLVTLAHVIFLMHFRSILIVTLPLPLAVLMSFLGMYYAGISSNIMSLAGIAIAIGVLVDAGIVVTENAFRFVERRGVDPRDRSRVWDAVRESTGLVGRPVFFSMAIILLAFVPVFALTGQEGKLFHPLAFTKTFAVLAATVIAVTLVPVLCTLLLAGRVHSEEANPVMRVLRRFYRPVLETALVHRGLTLTIAALLFAGALVLARGIGSEFMPPLNEGDLMFMPIADPSISLEQNTDIAARQNAALLKFPEVESVVAKVGRADTSTDPSPLNMTETIVHLKPRREWRAGMTLERLRGEMGRAAELPGVSNVWTMPIINRIDMLTTGIRSEVGVKIFGGDLFVLERLARRIADALGRVPGATNVYPEQVTNGQYLNIAVDRAAAARYGIRVGDIQQVIETAVGETTLTTTIEGRRRFPVRVRYAPEYRTDPQALGRVLVASPTGAQVPLSQVASIKQDRVRERPARRDRAAQRAGTRRWWIRQRGARRCHERRVAPRGLLRRLERTVGKPGARTWATPDGRAHRRACDFRAALFHLSLGAGSGARAARGSLRADRWRLPAVAAWLQLLGSGLGRVHRAVRNRGADRRRDGHLSRRGGRSQATRTGRHTDVGGTERCGPGRRAAPPSAKGDDRVDRGGGPPAHHVEHANRRGSDETARRSCAGRHGVVACPRADRHARHLLLAP
jgi:copper/silver efflux system protein